MPVTAQTILDKVRDQLVDNGTTPRWTDVELLSYLSDGQRTAVSYVPSAASTIDVVALVAGTKQALPSDGYMLLTVVRNIADDLTTGGRACRIVSRELLDGYMPTWHASTASAIVQNYIYEPQSPETFYVYPPNNGLGHVEIVYAVLPPVLTTGSSNLTLGEIYHSALFDYVMYRAHQKDGDFAAGQGVAAGYLQLFMQALGQGDAAQLSNNPNLQLYPPNPASKGTAK